MKLGLPVQWRIGGVMLVIGGLLGVVGAVVYNAIPGLFGTWLTVIGLFFEGAGLITVSFGFAADTIPTWTRRLLQITGALVIAEFAISVVQLVAPSVPSTISSVLFILVTAAFLISAVAIFRSPSIHGPIGWALIPAAVFEVVDYFLETSGYGGVWWIVAIFGALYVLAGVVFASRGLRSRAGSSARKRTLL